MADDLQIRGLVEVVTRFIGGKQTQEDLAQLEKSAERLGYRVKRTSPEMEKLRKDARKAGLQLKEFGDDAKKAGGGLSALGRQLIGFVGFAAISRFAKGAVTSFAEFERRLAAIGKQLDSLGLDASRNVPRIKSFLETMEALGVPVEEATASFQKFLGITRSVDGAMVAVRLATDATNAGLGPLSTNSERLANLLQGEVTEAAKSLGLALRDENDVIKTQEALLNDVIKTYDGFSKAQQDTQSDLETAEAQYSRIGRTVGELLAPAVGALSDAFVAVVKSIQTVGTVIGTALSTVIQGFTSFGRVAASALDLGALVRDPAKWFKDLNATIASEQDFLRSNIQQGADDIAAIWKAEADASIQTEEDRQKGLEAVRNVARAKLREKQVAEARKNAEEIAAAEAAGIEEGTRARLDAELRYLAIKRANAIAEAEATGKDVAAVAERYDRERIAKETEFARRIEKLNREAADRLLSQRIAAADEGSEERLAAELGLLSRAEAEALRVAESTGASTLAIEQTFALARKKLRADFYEDEKDRAIAAQRAIADELLRVAQETQDAETELALADIDARLAQRGLTLEQIGELEAEARQLRLDDTLRLLEEEKNAELQKIADVLQAQADAATDPDERADLLEKREKVLTAITAKYAARRAAIVKASDAVETASATQTANQKIALAMQTVSAVTGALSALFETNKAFAIANAIANTWQAVNAALASPPGPPWTIPLAAAVAAQGLANVLKIRSASPGGGGSGGAGGVAISAGAGAAVSGSPQRAPFSPAPPASVVNNTTQQQSGDTFEFNFTGVNVMGDKRATLRNLKRMLDRADRGRRL